uniref:Sortilin N-terminal domain-containing protein n=1 Tax=viral metagenome TaxID=1070528 RepID=A0A6C0BD86_9ZZZZ
MSSFDQNQELKTALNIKLASKISKAELERSDLLFTGDIAFTSRPTVNTVDLATADDLLGVVSSLSSYVQSSQLTGMLSDLAVSKPDFENYVEEDEQKDSLNQKQYFNFSRNYYPSSSPSQSWSCLTISSNGKYRYASTSDGKIYSSDDNGETWNLKSINVGKMINSICTSANGQYVAFTASDYDNSSGYPVLADYIYTSDNFGSGFTSRDNIQFWNGITMSSTGKYLMATCKESGAKYSNDYGESWFSPEVALTNGSCVTSSDSGRITYVACSGDAVYKSEDYGRTWSRREVGNYQWSSMATSSDGKYLIIAAKNDKKVIQSSNYGVDFTESPSELDYGLSDRENLTGLCMSGSGQYQLASIFNGPVCYSSNYGKSWSYIGPSSGLVSIAISRDGRYYSTCRPDNRIINSHSDIINIMYTVTNESLDPPTPVIGTFYFDSNDNKLRIYNGSYWVAFAPELA